MNALRLGILGGSFDPIHYGHLAIAEEARVALGLDRVLLVPAARQPLKGGRHAAAPIVELARIVAVARPAVTLDLAALARAIPRIGERLTLLDGPRLDI